jgi:hypothetical protein
MHYSIWHDVKSLNGQGSIIIAVQEGKRWDWHLSSLLSTPYRCLFIFIYMLLFLILVC